MTQLVRGMVAEDEAPQRQALCASLKAHWPTLDLVAVCEDGDAARVAVAQHHPQVAFLDIRMPGASGLDVAIDVVAHGGLVVFITAYEDYAIRAFEAGAIDYLLKPIQDTRLQQTITRLQERLNQPADGFAAQLEAVVRRLQSARPAPTRWITASVGDSVRMFDIDEVLYFQAQDKYVRVVTAGDEAIIRTPLKELLDMLDQDTFWQIHRSIIVRVSAIARVRKNELGRAELLLKQREEVLAVGASYLHRFRGM